MLYKNASNYFNIKNNFVVLEMVTAHYTLMTLS